MTGFSLADMFSFEKSLALLWRVTVELWMLGFNIYDRLGEIRDRQGGL